MNNYHIHSKYCKHAKGELFEYLDFAIKGNLKEIGISDHMPLSKNLLKSFYRFIEKSGSLSSRMDMNEIQKYLSEIDVLKKNDKVKVFSGFECEYNSFDLDYLEYLKSQVDYLNLGVHYVYKDKLLYDFMNNLVTDGENSRNIQLSDIEIYTENCVKAISSGLFNVLVHPDVFMKNFDNDIIDENIKKWSKRIIEAAIENKVLLELNTSDIFKAKKKNRRIRYPSDSFWKIVSEYKDAKILIGTDAHQPERVCDFQLEFISDFIKKHNLTIVDAIGSNIN